MEKIWCICFQFPWQDDGENIIINIEIYRWRRAREMREKSCLCLKAPRESPRVKPLQWVEKITKYRHFCTFWAAKNWKKFQSGVRHKCSSYSSVKQESWQNAGYDGKIAFLKVQNAESVGVREGKTRPFRGFYAPKSTFMDATVARGFMSDCTVMVLPTLQWLSHSGFGTLWW